MVIGGKKSVFLLFFLSRAMRHDDHTDRQVARSTRGRKSLSRVRYTTRYSPDG